jgi:hypothetical protein
MARWKLIEAHYIFAKRDGQGTEWEYKEINRANGREIRKKFQVPMHLDPKVETDWTHRPDGPYNDGIVVVATADTTDSHDIVIDAKDVTPGMLPMDDDARKISAKLDERVTPIPGDENATYSERLLDKFIQQLADAKSTVTSAPATPGVEKVLESMTAMMEQNQKILQALIERPRRV